MMLLQDVSVTTALTVFIRPTAIVIYGWFSKWITPENHYDKKHFVYIYFYCTFVQNC